MSLGGIAALIAAVAFVLLVGVLAVPLVKLGRTVDAATRAITDLTEQTVPVLAEVQVTVQGLNQTVDGLNDQLGKLDTVTDHVATLTGSIANLSALFSEAVSGPLVKVAAFSYGIRSAVRTRRSAELEHAVRDEMKSRRRRRGA